MLRNSVDKNEILRSAQDYCSKLIETLRHNMDSVMENYNFKAMLGVFGQQLDVLLVKIRELYESNEHAFMLNKQCLIDIALTIAKYTEQLMISCEETSINNNPKVRLEKCKEARFIEFCTCYNTKVKEQQARKAFIMQQKVDLESINQKIIKEKQDLQTLQAQIKIERQHTGKAIQYLCSILRPPIIEALTKSMKYAVHKSMARSDTYLQRAKYKVKVLETLLEQNNFDHYKLYLTDPEASFEKWMKYFVSQHCNELESNHDNTTIFQSLANEKQDNMLKFVEFVVTTITTYATNFNEWIKIFFSKMQHLNQIALVHSDIDFLLKLEITWQFEGLTKESFQRELLEKITPVIMNAGNGLYNHMEATLQVFIWDRFKRNLRGCTALCPFCKEKCDSLEECVNELHSVELHRPQCLGRYIWLNTKDIIVDLCPTLVGSNCKFRNSDTGGEFRYYKYYRNVYPEWFIATSAKELPVYWKWVVAHFAEDIAEWCCDANTDTVPKEWYDISMREAIDSLY